MPVEIQSPLPPLRHRIRASFFILIALHAALGLVMTAAVFFASGITPKVIHVNYDSIAAATQMRRAWTALQSPQLHAEKSSAQWSADFEAAITFEETNITEPGEGEIARKIRESFRQAKASGFKLAAGQYAGLNNALDELVAVNETGMFALAEESTTFGHRVFLASMLLFFVTLVLAVLLADSLAVRLARPIKDIAETLRGDPSLEHKLKLPKPNSLEMRILTNELGGLWTRVGQFQKLNVEQLSAERERLETVLTSVEDAVLVLDNEGRVIQVSDGMLRVLRLTAKDVVSHFWRDLSTQSENYLKLRNVLTRTLPAENAVELAVDAGKRTFAARLRDIVTPTGQKIGQVYLLHDITEMRHRERLRSEFIGVLSHELKTPLQSLGTAAELLASRAPKFDEDSRTLVETINEDVSRIRAVANDFVQVSVVDLRSLKLKLEKLPLSQLIQEWIKPFRVLARDRNVTLEFVKEGSDIIWAKIDAVKLPWAISNLLANAIRVSDAGTTVTVFITDRSEMAEIEIRDEGPGIPENVQTHMFEPYYQAPAGEGSRPSGFLGLGLTIAREVVEAHEGRIEYYPRRPHGSVFKISLPYTIVYG